MGVAWDSLKSIWTLGRLIPDEPFVGGISDAVMDLQTSASTLLTESWPGTAVDTLPQWHTTLGVAYDSSVTIADQQTRLAAMMTARGSMAIGLLQAQIQKEFPDVTVVETFIDSQAGEDECGVSVCGDTTGLIDWTSYTLDGDVPDDSAGPRLTAILARYAPAHMSPVSDLVVLSTEETSESGADECGLAVAEGYEGFAAVAPAFSVAAFIAGTGSVGSTLYAYPGVVTGSPTPSLSYQWKKDTVDIPGATTNAYTVDDGASYTCVVTATNAGGSASSTSAAIATPNIIPFVISGPTITPIDATLVCGATFEGYPNPVVTYQWRKDGVDIGGQTSTVLDVIGRGVGSYDCVVTGTNVAGATSVTSAATSVAVPVISWSGALGNSFGFPSGYRRIFVSGLSVIGFPPSVLTYQWYKNSVAYSTAEQLNEPVVSTTQYYCDVTATNDVGSDSQTSSTYTM